MRTLAIAEGVAWRMLHNFFHNKALLIPSLVFPLFFFAAFAGGLSGISHAPGLRLPDRLHRVPVRVRRAAVGGVRGCLHRLQHRPRLRERLRPAAAALRLPSHRHRARLPDRGPGAVVHDRVADHDHRLRRADERRRQRRRSPRPLPPRDRRQHHGDTLGGRSRDAPALDAGRPDDAGPGLPDPVLRPRLRAAGAAAGLDPRRRRRQPDDAHPRDGPKLRRGSAVRGRRGVPHRLRARRRCSSSGPFAAFAKPKQPDSLYPWPATARMAIASAWRSS